jgi:hypothetical protein
MQKHQPIPRDIDACLLHKWLIFPVETVRMVDDMWSPQFERLQEIVGEEKSFESLGGDGLPEGDPPRLELIREPTCQNMSRKARPMTFYVRACGWRCPPFIYY